MSEKHIYDPKTKTPIALAPLAGVSDAPFRLLCQKYGASTTFVEMLSATAITYDNQKTFQMMDKHPDEKYLGVQITSRNPEEMHKAVEKIPLERFCVVDVNMGCPVKKVVKSGCGSAILTDPERVYKTLHPLKSIAGDTKVSAKIRLGFNFEDRNFKEVIAAINESKIDLLTVHGRCRNENYTRPVDLGALAWIKKNTAIEVWGNGNLFCRADAEKMLSETKLDGIMVSRGALGNPWVFQMMKEPHFQVDRLTFAEDVSEHLKLQRIWHEKHPQRAIVCMRKHMLWYLKGWDKCMPLKQKIGTIDSWDAYERIIDEFLQITHNTGQINRHVSNASHPESFVYRDYDESIRQGAFKSGYPSSEYSSEFVNSMEDDVPKQRPAEWDPKYDMDQQYDAGVAE